MYRVIKTLTLLASRRFIFEPKPRNMPTRSDTLGRLDSFDPAPQGCLVNFHHYEIANTTTKILAPKKCRRSGI